MISRDRVIRTLNQQPIDRAPRDIWLLPGIEARCPDDIAEINVRFPPDIVHVNSPWPVGKRGKGSSSNSGTFTDVWGCLWREGENGSLPTLIESPLAGAAQLADYRFPPELLDGHRVAKVNKGCESTTRFTLAHSEARPLDRLRQLRGMETTLAELTENKPALHELLAKLHVCLAREIQHWAGTNVDGVVIGDNLAWVASARSHTKIWRSVFKPLYLEYCRILHAQDKFVFFLSNGPLGDGLEDLIEMGVDAVHAPWSRTDLIDLADRRRGQITFWSGIERNLIEPPQKCPQIRAAVFQIRKVLDYGAGGIIAQSAWAPATPIRSIITFCEEWMIQLPVTV